MYSDNAELLDRPRDLDRVMAEARRLRAEALAHYLRLAFSKAKNGVAALASPFRQWQQRAALEAELSGMSDCELRDIGLSRSDIGAVVDGSYRDERGARRQRRPILVRLDAGLRRPRASESASESKAA